MTRPQKLVDNIVFIDGFSGSGKSMFAPIVSSFERCELWLLDHSFEYMCTLDHFGQIDRKAAAMMVQLQADLDLYNLMIARNTNFREGDDSGVASNLLSERYRKRLQEEDGDQITGKIQTADPILCIMTHWIFPMSNLLFDALGTRLKIFVVSVRHPFWLIENWFKGRWEARLGQDPRDFQLCYQRGGRVFPWSAYGWEEEYFQTSWLEKVIQTVASYVDGCQEMRGRLGAGDRQKVRFFPFERFAADPSPYLQQLTGLLGTEASSKTSRIMTKMNVPRIHPADYLERKKREFTLLLESEGVRDKYRELAFRLAKDYEKTYLEG